MKEKSVLAWYFARPDKRLANGDGRVIRVGETHEVTGTPVLCEHGLHGSIRPLDALHYASSSTVFRVRLSGQLVKGANKCVALKRTYIAELDAEIVLREFARKCASTVLHSWDAPDVVKQWLKTGDPSLRSAAWSAASHSPSAAAAESTARSAAEWSAVRSTAWSAAESAAQSAAESAAWSAVRSAVRSKVWSAARNAAWDTARRAVRRAQSNELHVMLLTAISGVKK